VNHPQGSAKPSNNTTLLHTPVLYQEVLHALQPTDGKRYVDGTVGLGGHALGILSASSPTGKLLGFDRDPNALKIATQRLQPFAERAILLHTSYLEMPAGLAQVGWQQVDGILLDLGLSSLQLDSAERGFSFRQEGPLDMRFDPAASLSAADVVNSWSATELASIFWDYGEERFSQRIAQAIVQARPLRSTHQLANLVDRVVPKKGRTPGIHPATRVFQALRIAVNDELQAVAKVLPLAVSYLAPAGRLAVISFHSLEDRIVKQFMRRESSDCICPPEQPVCTCEHQASLRELHRKPISASAAEILQNSRSRSAKLRVAERLSE